MAKLNNVRKSMKENKLQAKVDRQMVAIVAEKGTALVFDGSAESSYISGDSSVDSALQALIDILESVPNNTDSLIAKPVRIVLPSIISGVATGSFIDYVRTGKSVTSGEAMPKERIEAYAKVMKLMASKYANVELVADRNKSNEDRAVASQAWEVLKSHIAQVVRQGAVAQAPEMSAEDKARVAELKAKLAKLEDELLEADGEEAEQKIENKIAKVQSMIARTLANAGQVAEEEKQEMPTTNQVKDLF